MSPRKWPIGLMTAKEFARLTSDEAVADARCAAMDRYRRRIEMLNNEAIHRLDIADPVGFSIIVGALDTLCDGWCLEEGAMANA